jgi:hypothetical protein
LALKDYLRAAVRWQRSLFTQAPTTLIKNIALVAEHFRDHGLLLQDYVQAAAKNQPSLFVIPPATAIEHIEVVVEHFRGQGLALKDYLRAAVKKQPSLFASKPATIIGHINLIIDLHCQGLIAFPQQKDAPLGQPLKPLFHWLIMHPQYFTLADENYALRNVSAHISRDGHARSTFLTRARYQVEDELAAHLGHADLTKPVPKSA